MGKVTELWLTRLVVSLHGIARQGPQTSQFKIHLLMGFSMNAAIKDSFQNRRSPAADRDPSGGKVRQILFDFQ